MKRIIASILVLSLLFMLASCNKKEAQVSSSISNSAYKVTDSRGVEVTFDKVPEKIISLIPSDTEIIYELGVGDKLIAVSNYCNYPEDTKNKQKLASGTKISIEAIIGLKPDVVFLGKMDQTEDQFKQLESAGVKIIVTNASNIEDAYKVIQMIGKTLNKTTKAEMIINDMRTGFNTIKEQVKGKTPQKVYVEISPLQYGLYSCGKGTFHDELITMLGAENIFADLTSWVKVSEEQVISRNPEVIFTTVSMTEGISDAVGEIKGRKNWNKINAVKNSKVYILDADILARPGPRLVQAAKDMVKALYGI